MKPMVLVVDDEPLQREIMKTILDGAGYETHTAGSGREALVLAAKFKPDVILTDLKMAGMDGIELLESLPAMEVAPAVIIVTAHGTIASAVDALKRGALDYLTKPLDKDKVLFTVSKACERGEILKENVRLKKELFDRFSLEGIVGQSSRMTEIVNLLRKVSGASATVMLRGESGTGKELAARAIHYNSPRRTRPFTAINCAAIPESLFESELFGYEPGAFTGAVGRREGLIEMTQGGTLLLDEVGDLPMAMQSKLLRVLQDREIRRVGGKEAVKVDVRIISATNKNLEIELEKGTFREDLYYRLNVVLIELPPLRERPDDIVPLVDFFLRKYNNEFGRRVRAVSPEALRALREYRWPGNVRQLESVIERAVLLSEAEVLSLEDISSILFARRFDGRLQFELPDEGLDFEALERTVLQQALQRSGGVASKAARLLRMNYKAFLYRLEKFGIKDGGNDREGDEPK